MVIIECELQCPFQKVEDGCFVCIVKEDEYKDQEAAMICNGQSEIPFSECPIYQCEVPPPWEK